MVKQLMIAMLAVAGFCMMPSQTEAQSTYNTGIGLRGGITNGLTVKHFLDEANALEGIVSTRHGGFQITGLYERHAPAFDVDRMNWFYGAGGHIGAYNEYNGPFDNDKYGNGQPVIGVDGIIGLEYHIEPIPFTIGVSAKPFFEFAEPGFVFWDAGLSFRYAF